VFKLNGKHIKIEQKIKHGKFTVEFQKDSGGKLLQINYNGAELLSVYDSVKPEEICINFNSVLKPIPSMIQGVLSLAHIEKKRCKK